MTFRTVALALALCSSFTVAAEAAKRKPAAVRPVRPVTRKVKPGRNKATKYKAAKYKAPKYKARKAAVAKRKIG